MSSVRLRALALACLVSGCHAELASDLEEREADAIVLALDDVGLAAWKTRGAGAHASRFAVEVERGELVRAMTVLRDAELPRRESPGMGALLSESRLVPDVGVERARVAAATAGELERTLEGIDGVQRARVHIALPAPRSLDDAPGQPRASVSIRALDHAPGDEALRALISGAVDGLAPDAVTVVRSAGRAPAAPGRARFVSVGPLAVSPSSAPLLKGALGASLALHLVLASALLYRRRRGVADRSSATGRAADPRGGESSARAEQRG